MNGVKKYLYQMWLAFRFRNPRLFFWCDIHPHAVIPRSTRFCHGGMGVIIGKNTVLGENVTIHPNVTFGARTPHNGHPINHVRVGNHVCIYTGATILGDISIGDHAVVAAHSLVLRDVPDYGYVRGVPGRVVMIDE